VKRVVIEMLEECICIANGHVAVHEIPVPINIPWAWVPPEVAPGKAHCVPVAIAPRHR
jgi:hypothetical protein